MELETRMFTVHGRTKILRLKLNIYLALLRRLKNIGMASRKMYQNTLNPTLLSGESRRAYHQFPTPIVSLFCFTLLT